MLQRTKWLLVIVVWIGFIGLSFALLERSEFGGGDFRLYYSAARNYLPERMPYLTVIGVQPDTLNYPPLLPQLLMPLAKTLDEPAARRVWFGISVFAMLTLLAALMRYVRPRQRFLLWLLAAFFAPCFEALRIGQVNVILMALIGFAWVAAKEDRRLVSGVLLAAAAWIKIYPALILIYFLWKRDWQAVRGGLIGGIFLGLFQILVSGVDVLVEFFRSLLIVSGQAESNLMWKNSSIYGFAAKLFQQTDRSTALLVNPPLFMLTRFGLSAFVLIALFYLSAKSAPHQKSLRYNIRFDLEYALAVLTMLLVSPWLYADSISPVFITGYILWRVGSGLLNRVLLLLVGTLIIANYLLMWQEGAGFSALILSLGFYALALLWAMDIWALRKTTAADTSGAPSF